MNPLAHAFHMGNVTGHSMIASLIGALWIIGGAPAAIAQEPLTPPFSAPSPEARETRPTVQPLTLAGCYRLALQQSETIAIQQERLKETEGRFLQALSAALPRASFALSQRRQDGSGGSAFTLRDVPERKLAFTQPLFSGFKEFAAMAGARAERRQRTHEKTRAEHLLFLDVVSAFYGLLEYREDLKALEAIRLGLLQRIDELRARERLGRSRPSEVVSAESQLRRIEAEVERVRGLETISRQMLEFLTGMEEIQDVTDEEVSRPPPASAEASLSKANARPDVQAAEEASRVAARELNIAQAKLFPTVNLESNYYTKRVGASSGVDWDVIVKVDVPIFQGGQAVGGIRESAARARQARLQLAQAQRTAELDIRDALAALETGVDRRDLLERAWQAAEEDYRLQVEDYRLNLVNNLNVLDALQRLEDAKRDVLHAQYEVKRLSWRLRVATGEPW